MKQMSEIYSLLIHSYTHTLARTGPHPEASPNLILNRLILTQPAGDEWAKNSMSVGNLRDLSISVFLTQMSWLVNTIFFWLLFSHPISFFFFHFTKLLHYWACSVCHSFFPPALAFKESDILWPSSFLQSISLFSNVPSLLTLHVTLCSKCVKSAICVCFMCYTVR